MGSLVCEGGLGECGGRMLVGWYEGLLAEGFRWWRLRGACWGCAGGCMGGGTWLDAEAVKGGLVAGGWRERVSCTVVAFGVCCWDGVVVGVYCWLLAGCWGLVVAVASVAISSGGGSEGSVGRWWCGWVVCWFVRPCWGVPYFPVECVPVGGDSVGGRVWSISSGSARIIWHRCSRVGSRPGGQLGVGWSWLHRQHTQ